MEKTVKTEDRRALTAFLRTLGGEDGEAFAKNPKVLEAFSALLSDKTIGAFLNSSGAEMENSDQIHLASLEERREAMVFELLGFYKQIRSTISDIEGRQGAQKAST